MYRLARSYFKMIDAEIIFILKDVSSPITVSFLFNMKI